MLKKGLLTLGSIVFLLSGIGYAEAAETVIPYPNGYDTKSEGASAAPLEINHRASSYFKHPDYYNLKSNANLTILSNYKTYQQTTEYSCGPAAALTVMEHFKVGGYDELGLAKGMKTQPYPIGSNPADMENFFKELGWQTDSSLHHEPFNDMSGFTSFVLANLHNNTPIMVENVDWGGHWRVIIGYDTMGTATDLDDVLIMMDSYDICDHLQDGYVAVNAEKFFSMWFDHSMLPENQRVQPWLIAKPNKKVSNEG